MNDQLRKPPAATNPVEAALSELPFQFKHVKDSLDLPTAAKWLRHDARDDFIPDPIQFRDVEALAEEYVSARSRDIFHAYGHPPLKSTEPKGHFLLRPTLYIHPRQRIVYLSIPHYPLAEGWTSRPFECLCLQP